MVARRVDVNLHVCNPIAFARRIEAPYDFPSTGPAYWSPEVLGRSFTSHYEYVNAQSTWHLDAARKAGTAGCVIAGNRAATLAPRTRWKYMGNSSSTPVGGACYSVHLAGAEQAVQPVVNGLAFTSIANTADPYASIDDCIEVMRSILMGPLGGDLGTGGYLVIDGTSYTVENPSVVAAEYNAKIAGLVQQMSEATEVEYEPPSLLTSSGSQGTKVHEYDVNCSATLSKSETVSGYIASGSSIFKTEGQRKVTIDKVYDWLQASATALRLAMVEAAASGVPIPQNVLQLESRPAEMAWLTQAELDAVEEYIMSLYSLRSEANANLTGAQESLQTAYDKYVANLPEGGTALSKDDWVSKLIETANSADKGLDNKSWYESVWDAIKGFGSSTLDFIVDNPGLSAGIGGVIGAKTGLIEPWMLLLGGAVALLLILK